MWLCTAGHCGVRSGIRFHRKPMRGATYAHLLVATVWLGAGTPAGATIDRVKDALSGSMTLNTILGQTPDSTTRGCRHTACAALNDVANSLLMLKARDYPSGPALLNPQAYKPNDDNNKVRHLLATHPGRTNAYCDVLRIIARRYDQHSDAAIGRRAIEIASLISPSCAQSMVAALLKTKAVDDMLAELESGVGSLKSQAAVSWSAIRGIPEPPPRSDCRLFLSKDGETTRSRLIAGSRTDRPGGRQGGTSRLALSY